MTHFRQLNEQTRITTEGERQHLIQSLIRQQSLVTRMMERSLIPQLFDLDLTIPQIKLLFLLNTHTWLKINKVAQALKRDLATINDIVDKLAERRLVARGIDAIVAITPQGKELSEGLARSGNTNLLNLLEKLSFQELNVLMQASDIMVKASLDRSEELSRL